MIEIATNRLKELEAIIERDMAAFVRVGNALMEIREKRLYEGSCGTFAEYLKERWPQYGKAYLYRLMDATYIRGYLQKSTIVDFLPEIEAQTKPLTKLGTPKQVEMGKADPELWAEAWIRACDLASPEYPTERHVAETVTNMLREERNQSTPIEIVDWMGEWRVPGIYRADTSTPEFLASLPESCVDMVISDPPWEESSLELYATLGKLALKTLKPGRFALVYFGKMFLPEIMSMMTRYLDYVWTMAIYQPDSNDRIRKWQIYSAWRPVCLFKKPGEADLLTWIPDSTKSTRDKSFHEWGQDSRPVQFWLNAFTRKNELVADFFAGGGMTPAAAQQAGRQWVAFDKSEENVQTMGLRLADERA